MVKFYACMLLVKNSYCVVLWIKLTSSIFLCAKKIYSAEVYIQWVFVFRAMAAIFLWAMCFYQCLNQKTIGNFMKVFFVWCWIYLVRKDRISWIHINIYLMFCICVIFMNVYVLCMWSYKICYKERLVLFETCEIN